MKASPWYPFPHWWEPFSCLLLYVHLTDFPSAFASFALLEVVTSPKAEIPNEAYCQSGLAFNVCVVFSPCKLTCWMLSTNSKTRAWVICRLSSSQTTPQQSVRKFMLQVNPVTLSSPQEVRQPSFSYTTVNFKSIRICQDQSQSNALRQAQSGIRGVICFLSRCGTNSGRCDNGRCE